MVTNNSLNNTSSTFNPDELTVNSVYTFPDADGTAGDILYAETGTDVSWQENISEENLVQNVFASTTSLVSSTTGLPYARDTIPQNTEGDEILTATITPKSSTNKLLIQFSCSFAVSSVTAVSGALFQDSTANALSASIFQIADGANYTGSGIITHIMDAGTTSSTTFKIRADQLWLLLYM